MMNVKYLKNPKTKEKFYPITKSDCIIDAFSINALEIDRLFEDSLSVSNHQKGMSYLNLQGLQHYHSKIADYLNNTISKIPSIYLTGYATEDWVKENSLYKIYENTSIEEVKSLLGDSVKVGTIVAIVDENSITEYQWQIVEKQQCAKITNSEKDSYFIVVRDPSLDKGDGTEAWVYKESGKLWMHVLPDRSYIEMGQINYWINTYTENIYDFKLKGFKYSGVLNSFAVGDTSTANGRNSLATGFETTADGNASTAEGQNTKASGVASHAEGYLTEASNFTSHAEGKNSIAEGQASHAEGAFTKAKGDFSHSEGYLAESSGNQSHAEGYSTSSLGNGSHAEGDSTIANSRYSHAEGGRTQTGYTEETNTIQVDPSEDTPGTYSHAEGNATATYGNAAHAEGRKTFAKGNQSHAEGNQTYAEGNQSHAEGWGTKALGKGSHAEGQFTSTITSFQVSQLSTEQQTILANKYGISANCMSVSDKLPEGILGDIYSDPECTNFIAKVTLNFYCNEVGGTDIICIEGSELSSGVTYYFKGKSGAFGQASHSEGYNTNAVADNSHAEGSETSAHGIGSHAEGGFTLANGQYAHAEGAGTAASGRRSHAEGIYSVSAGEGSHAEGVKTEAKNYSEHAEGQFNLSNKQSTTYGNALNTQHSVGIGTGYTARKNAFEIMQNGDAYLIGIGGYNGTNPSTSKTLQQSISAVATIDDSTESATSTYSSKKIGKLIADGKFSIKSVNTLPETGAARTIYLLPSTADDGTHDEYLYINDKWELIGNTKTDLSNYYSKAETDTLLLNKQDAITWGSNIVVENGVVNSKDTTYSNVSTSESGLMSSSDKIKLDSLSNYTLPQATTSVLGGIKVDGDIFTINENGVIQAAKLLSSIEELNNQLSLLEAAKPSMIIYETVDQQPINIDKTYLTEANVYKHENNNILFDAKIRDVWKQSFQNNLYISNITISKDSNYIGQSAFQNCSKLQSVQGVDNIKGIQDSAFLGCSMLMQLPTSDILTNIGEAAFKNCISLSNIILPNSLKTIGTSAFEGCTSLNSLTIGNNVTDIYMSAFKDCTNLTEVTIPDSVLTLGTTVFQNCTSLNSITFGSGLTNIAGGVINGCSALKTITCKASTPPAMNGGNYLTSVTVVYVPESSLNAYKSASQWSSYASVMVAY